MSEINNLDLYTIGNNIRDLNVPVSDIKSVVKNVPDDSIYAEKVAVVVAVSILPSPSVSKKL